MINRLTPPRIDSILQSPDDGMAAFLKRAASIGKLQEYLRELFPEPIAQQVWAGDVQAGVLTVLTNTPVFASRVRLASHQIISHLKDKGLVLQGVAVKVKPQMRPPAPPAAALGRPLVMGAAARAEMAALARSMGADDGNALGRSLLKLAQSAGDIPEASSQHVAPEEPSPPLTQPPPLALPQLPPHVRARMVATARELGSDRLGRTLLKLALRGDAPMPSEAEISAALPVAAWEEETRYPPRPATKVSPRTHAQLRALGEDLGGAFAALAANLHTDPSIPDREDLYQGEDGTPGEPSANTNPPRKREPTISAATRDRIIQMARNNEFGGLTKAMVKLAQSIEALSEDVEAQATQSTDEIPETSRLRPQGNPE